MHKVLIVSDSHGWKTSLSDIKARHQIPSKIHCGDSELPYDAKEMDGFIKVRGNCDFDERYPMEQNTIISDIQFYITHGHLYNVNQTLNNVAYRGAEVGANIVCYGHTHHALCEKHGELLLINPGSIKEPRGRKEQTYVVLSWIDKDEVHVQFYLENGEPFEELSKVVSFN